MALTMDPAALNAAAVQAATEAMLTAGFGHWEEDGEDGDEEAAGVGVGGGGPPHGLQFHLAAQHTAAAASSLSALPSSAFFSALRVGEGVDALDLIGFTQWRHAIVLDSRHDEQEFKIRWAGWDEKWNEWVHCLRLAPAHSKVLGDTGPEDSAEKTLVTVLGNEWYHFLQTNPGLLSDVHIKLEGRTPWAIMQQAREATTKSREDDLSRRASIASATTPPRHYASASPPSYASLDPDDEDDYESANDGFSLSLSPSAFRHTMPSPSPPPASTASRPLPSLTLYGHESFLRVRCPRLFKFLRDVPANGSSATASEASKWADEMDLKSGGGGFKATPEKGSKAQLFSQCAGAKLKHAPNARVSTAALSSLPAAFTPPPSARLAKSASIGALTKSPAAGSQTARTTLTRNASTATISTPPTGSKTSRKSTGSVVAKPAASRSGWASTPTSPPALLHSASQPPVTPARRSLTSASSARVPIAASSVSRSRTPNVSAPATPKLKPSASPAHTPAASPTAARSKFANVQSKLSTRRPVPSAVPSSLATPSPSAKKVTPSRSVSDPLANGASASPEVQSSPDGSSPSSDTELEDADAPEEECSPATSLMSSASAPNTLAAPSAALFPASSLSSPTKHEEEEKEATTASAPPAAVTPPRPTHKLLVLPLSSPRVLHAFFEYCYTDNIAHAAVERKPSGDAAKKPPASSSTRGQRYRRELNLDAESDSDDIAASSSAMSVLDLFELACLASSLHDSRLMALAALHIQRALHSNNIMAALQVLDALGALKHSQERHQQAPTLSVHLNGCLALDKQDHATHPTQAAGKPARSSPAPTSSPLLSPTPASYLAADTPASFLRSGLNLCGSSSCDFDLISRLVLEFLALRWSDIFAGGDGANMKLLHSCAFDTFQLVVNLRNGAPVTHGPDGTVLPSQHVFKSMEEKAIFNQSQINAALIAAGIQPAAHHNLFTHAAGVGGANGLPHATSHQELIALIASPSIALPACGLLKTLRALYDQPRNQHTCDVRILIEDDSAARGLASADGKPRRLPVKATLWAHKIVLACGSEFFRTFFGGNASRGSAAYLAHGGGGKSAWDQSLSGCDDSDSEFPGVSTVRFPSSSWTAASMDVVLRYAYYNETRHGIDFVTALYVMNAHVTNYLGLRSYTAGVATGSSAAAAAASPTPAPTSFVSDIEKSCIALLHASLSASVSSAGSGSLSASPLADDCLTIIQSAFAYGDRSLFEKACLFLDWSHIDLLMSAATKRRRVEDQREKAECLRHLQRRNERNKARERRGRSDHHQPTADDEPSPVSSDLSSDESDPEDEVHRLVLQDAEPTSAMQLDFVSAIIAEKARVAALNRIR